MLNKKIHMLSSIWNGVNSLFDIFVADLLLLLHHTVAFNNSIFDVIAIVFVPQNGNHSLLI